SSNTGSQICCARPRSAPAGDGGGSRRYAPMTRLDAGGVNDAAPIAVAFVRVLRGAGLEVPVTATIGFCEALAAVGVDDREQVYWAGRATLVWRPEDADPYDRAFRTFWEWWAPSGVAEPEPEPESLTLAIDQDGDGDSDADAAEAGDEEVIQLRFSAAEVLRHKDFADYTAIELA